MLILSYGITKSGSTLAFELAKGILTSAGYEQPRLPDRVVTSGHNINFIERANAATLGALIETIGPDRRIVVKCHCRFDLKLLDRIEAWIAAGDLQIHAAYRDPREICLSLLDAGERARAANRKEFSEIETLDKAIRVCRRQIDTFTRWAMINGALVLFYNDVAFDFETTISRMAEHLGVEPDRDAVRTYAFEQAFTQKNKAVLDRYKDDLTVRENERLLETFGGFIRFACEQPIEPWLAKRRAHLLSLL
ncbi:MAG: hypothetical protein ACFB2Z_04085 [Maricaulaceae bacterium]